MLYLRATGLLLLAVALAAQQTVGGLRGVVTDSTAAVIPSATITLGPTFANSHLVFSWCSTPSGG
jgi:hypothetical protein